MKSYSTAIELAQLAGETCALVDLQLEFGSVATYFDARPAHTIADLTTSANEADTRMVEQAMTVLPSNVAVLARPERVEQAANVNPESIANILRILETVVRKSGSYYPALGKRANLCTETGKESTLFAILWRGRLW